MTISARRRALLLSTGALVAAHAALPRPATAQPGWPTRPVRLVVPFPAGGATDIVARITAQRLSTSLGQQVVVENRPGAGGTIGADAVAKASPDGHVLLLSTSSTHSIGPAINPRLPYDAFRDFVPVAQIANAPSVLVVGSAFPNGDARALVAAVKAAPGKHNYGSSGIGTYPHLMAELFKWRAGGLFAVHIPYRGTGLVVPDLVAGQITFLMDSVVSAQPHLRDGKIRALAVSGGRRSSALPAVPTFAEIGIPGMEVSNWFGILAPAGTPADVVQRVNREVAAMLRQPDVMERLQTAGAEPATGTPEQFGKVVRDEYESWKAVISRAGIKPE